MKHLSKYILPRYTWFLIWYKQWFKNLDGIKQFAHQVMNWIMQSTLGMASRLKKENKRLAEKVKESKKILLKLYQHPTVEGDEFDTVRSKVRKLGAFILIGITAETALNYFAVKSLITVNGWGYMLLQIILALALTVGGIYIFERFFTAIINKPAYKQTDAEPKSWKEIAFLVLLVVAYECTIYYLCRVRGVALEGKNNDGYVTNFVMLSGMILPLCIGYLAYERNVYYSAYKNTLRIAHLERNIAAMENRIATNIQRMETHFKQQCEDRWAFLQEFKTYKENYNEKHGMAHEILAGHFAETQETFILEAIERYKKEAINEALMKPTTIPNNPIREIGQLSETPVNQDSRKLNGQINDLFSNFKTK